MEYMKRYERWRNSEALNAAERGELDAIEANPKEIESRFYEQMKFGTAGLRGTMGVGLNRMNIHVVRHVTQAFAEVILEAGSKMARSGVAVCYDCRNNSRAFAEAASCVMAANKIPVRIFESLRPTPELSFAVRHFGCAAGINVTASHNPKEYNGYKVYWADGAQLPPEHAAAIADKMKILDVFDDVKTVDFRSAVDSGFITVMGSETDEAFLSNVMAQATEFDTVKRVAGRFSMVYTPFHGTGYRLVPEALRRLGIRNLYCVAEQMEPDGSFPTVVSPNPENPEGFALAVRLADNQHADFILGTDPDADRVGIMIRNARGTFVHVSGNQTGVLLLDYLIGAKKRAGTMPDNPVILKTIVTTEMARKVAESNGVRCIDTFTGFKFMAERKNEIESSDAGCVIFSYEESYGYMVGDFVRDKDAVTASLLLTEMAAWYADRDMTLSDALQALYEKYGHYEEKTVNLVMPGLDGLHRMKDLMNTLRTSPPASIAGSNVSVRKDYLNGTSVETATGERNVMTLSGSNVLRYELEDLTTILIRPSGTEPKIKVYILVSGSCTEDCGERIGRYSDWAMKLKQ